MTLKKNFAYRKQLRIRMLDTTKATISIYHVFGSHVHSGEISVDVHNMSPIGMQFATYLRFPVSSDFALRIKLQLGEWEFSLLGHIEWRRKEDNQFLYGCSFLPDQKTRFAIVRALNDRLRLMCPNHVRIHELYQRMSEVHSPGTSHMDARG